MMSSKKVLAFKLLLACGLCLVVMVGTVKLVQWLV